MKIECSFFFRLLKFENHSYTWNFRGPWILLPLVVMTRVWVGRRNWRNSRNSTGHCSTYHSLKNWGSCLVFQRKCPRRKKKRWWLKYHFLLKKPKCILLKYSIPPDWIFKSLQTFYNKSAAQSGTWIFKSVHVYYLFKIYLSSFCEEICSKFIFPHFVLYL